MITGGGEVLRTYDLGRYKGVLIEAPECFGPIKYVYVLVIFEKEGEEPVLFVTSEKNEMQAMLLATAAETNPEIVSELNPNKCFLGVYSKSGRENHGGSMDWCKLEEFEKKSLEIVGERLGVSVTTEHNSPRDNSPRSPRNGRNEKITAYPFQSVLLAILATIVSLSVTIVGHVLFYLFDEMRGIADDWMQTLFRELLMPGAGGYAGIYVIHNYFVHYTKGIVLWMYSVLLMSLYLSSWLFVLPYAQKADISGYDLTVHFLSIISAAIGIYLANRTYWSRPRSRPRTRP